MDIKEYIASGIIEDYLLGTASEQQRREVECMSKIYPEIQQELERTAEALETYARQYEQKPPDDLKKNIFAKIEKDTTDAKVVDIRKAKDTENQEEASFAPLMLKLWTAASIMIIIGLVAYNYVKTKDFGSYENQISQLITENQQLAEDYNSLAKRNNKVAHELAMFRNPEFKTVFLQGLKDKAPNSLAIICWNKKTKKVMLCIDKLPEPPKGKQYQLWAIENDNPKDMGMINLEKSKDFTTLKKSSDNPQAFAITLEDAGGSPKPTLDQMYVIGKV